MKRSVPERASVISTMHRMLVVSTLKHVQNAATNINSGVCAKGHRPCPGRSNRLTFSRQSKLFTCLSDGLYLGKYKPKIDTSLMRYRPQIREDLSAQLMEFALAIVYVSYRGVFCSRRSRWSAGVEI